MCERESAFCVQARERDCSRSGMMRTARLTGRCVCWDERAGVSDRDLAAAPRRRQQGHPGRIRRNVQVLLRRVPLGALAPIPSRVPSLSRLLHSPARRMPAHQLARPLCRDVMNTFGGMAAFAIVVTLLLWAVDLRAGGWLNASAAMLQEHEIAVAKEVCAPCLCAFGFGTRACVFVCRGAGPIWVWPGCDREASCVVLRARVFGGSAWCGDEGWCGDAGSGVLRERVSAGCGD
eukprot:1784398-Rhodomonas_salina.3